MSSRSNDSDLSRNKQKKKKDDQTLPRAPSKSSSQSASTSSPILAPAAELAPSLSPSTQSAAEPSFIPSLQLRTTVLPADPLAGLQPRTFRATGLKPSSTIDTVTSTISSLSQQANRGLSSFLSSSSSSPHTRTSIDQTPPPDGTASPIYDAFENVGTLQGQGATGPDVHAAAFMQDVEDIRSRRVVWSHWDRLLIRDPDLRSAPLLLSYFRNGTLQALLVQDDQVTEILSLPQAASVLEASNGQAELATSVTARVRHPLTGQTDPQLLVVLSGDGQASRLVSYSLSSHQILSSVQLQHWSPSHAQSTQLERADSVDIQSNERYVVLSFSSPPSIHVLSASSLQYLLPPISGLTPGPHQRPPPMSLSNRLLAFAHPSKTDLTSILSESRNPSSTHASESVRPRSGAQPNVAARVGEMRDNLFETSAHVGDAARRLGGGVVSGMRALGEWSSSYLSQHHPISAPDALASTPSSGLLSQSAPQSSHLAKSISSTSSSPMLAPVDPRPKRLSTENAEGFAAKETPERAEGVVSGATCVRVVDLGSGASHLCTFASSNHPVSLVSFSPCGRLLLTADSLGHAFHVFELQARGLFGGQPAHNMQLPLVHRYKLIRGITTADVLQAAWTHDTQWVAVGTRNGTVHFYAINPFGGPPCVANHAERKIQNGRSLQPLGLPLGSIARSARPSRPDDTPMQLDPSKEQQTNTVTPPRTVATHAPDLPSFTLFSNPAESASVLEKGQASAVTSMLSYDPRTASITLHSLRCRRIQPKAQMESTVGSRTPAASEFRRRSSNASTRSSGLSQMMRRAGEGLLHSPTLSRLVAECTRVAVWNSLVPSTSSVVKQVMVAAVRNDAAKTANALRESPAAWVSNAELETYSQAPAVLPSSLFLSRQAYFHARKLDSHVSQLDDPAPFRSVHRADHRPIKVRETPRVISREASGDEPNSYDESLAGALDAMTFDPDRISARSPSARIPSFPQGQRGRSAGWTSSSIPIRIVAGGLGGVYRAGKELGRGVEIARRRTSGGGTGHPGSRSLSGLSDASPQPPTISVSFDGAEEIDLLHDEDDAQAPIAPGGRTVGSIASEASIPSILGHDGRSRGSNPSSAETPLTRFSEGEELPSDALDADDFDWDALDEPVVADSGSMQRLAKEKGPRLSKVDELGSMDDDFTVGMLDEDSLMGEQDSPSTGSNGGLQVGSDPKEFVYTLRTGGSTRSSLLSHSSGATMHELRSDDKSSSKRDSSPCNSESDGSGNASGVSGQLCEGNKETHTFAPTVPGALPTAPVPVATPTVKTSTSSKKKKKHGR